MWILDCEGPLFGGVRMWLRPNSRFVLGRIKAGDVTFPLASQKSISRTHLIINVSPVNDEDGLRIHTRSQVTLQDNHTKHGTKVDGEEIRGGNKTLTGDVHRFTLGKCDDVFRISWVPVVLSFSLSSREKKSSKTALIPHRKKVEAFDIKTIGTWTSETTHVVASKRNTAIGLQALVNGRAIVTHEYLEAIVEVAAQPESPEDRAPLERDFDKYFPDPEKFLPPRKNEPVPRPADLFRPDERRRRVFEGWLFIFCDDAQYSNLLGPITDGHGKAEKFTLHYPNTIAPDIIDFVKKRSHGSQVAVVSFEYKQDPDWSAKLLSETEALLGYQTVEQNAFLDIILTCNTAELRKPLEHEFSPDATPAEPPPPTPKAPTPPPPKQETQPAPRRARRRLPMAATGFDFDLGGDFLPAPTPAPETQAAPSPPPPDSSIPDSYAPPDPTQTPDPTPHTATPLKRPPPSSPADESLDIMSLLPNTTLIKRRKLAEPPSARPRSPSPPPANPPTPPPPKPQKKIKDEPLHLTQSRLHRAQQDAEHEVKDEPLDPDSIHRLKNLAIVETMPVLPPRRAPRREPGERGPEWREEWEGRRNFKGFRRAPRNPALRKMVAVVEAGEGAGAEYWMGEVREGGARGARHGRREEREEDEEAEMEVEDAEEEEVQFSAGRGRGGRVERAGRGRDEVEMRSPLKRQATQEPERRSARGGKRARVVESEEEDSDDEDGLRFRLR